MKSLSIVFVLLLTGCGTLKDYTVYKANDGLYRTAIQGERYELLSTPERAMRDKQGQLLTDEKAATLRLRSLTGPLDLERSFRLPDCSSTAIYNAKVYQFRAQKSLKEKAFQKALVDLDAAEIECAQIGRISAQDYFRALALARLGELTEAKDAANRFLREAAAVDPAAYQQGNRVNSREDMKHFEDETAEFAKLRENMETFIATGAAPIDLVDNQEVAKFDHNAFFHPGGNRRQGIFVFPTIIYSNLVGFNAGGIGYYSWGKYGLGLSYVGGSLGSSYGFKFRDSVYESAKRDWDVDLFAAGYTHKRFKYKSDGYEYTNVSVVSTAFEPGVGVGATKRWTPQFGVSAEGTIFTNQLRGGSNAIGSLFAFYNIWQDMGPTIGYIQNRPMIAWEILFLQFGYDFRNHSINAVTQGFTF